MKTTWEIENGALKITVKDGSTEKSWILRKSHAPEKLGAAFFELAKALGPIAVASGPGVMPKALYMSGRVEKDGSYSDFTPEREPPERAALRKQAEEAKANAEWAHATNDEDTMAAIGSKLPEFKAAGDTTGFSVLPPPSAAIDGTVYDNKQYRKDKSNWVKE